MRWPYGLNLGNSLDGIGSCSVYLHVTLTSMIIKSVLKILTPVSISK